MAKSGTGSQHIAGEHCGLETELTDREVEFFDGLFGSVHRDHRRGCQTVAVRAEELGVVEVEGAGARTTQLLVGHAGQGDDEKALAGVHDREVETDLVHALVEIARQRGRGAIEGVLGWYRPPHGYRGALIFALVEGLAKCPTRMHEVVDEPVGHLRPADVADEVHDHGQHFELMRIGIDDRMIELCPNRTQPLIRISDTRHLRPRS